MAYPQPVPSLSEDEFDHFCQAVDEFETPDGMEDDLARHREALRDED
jgi:hypothetical protein